MPNRPRRFKYTDADQSLVRLTPVGRTYDCDAGDPILYIAPQQPVPKLVTE